MPDWRLPNGKGTYVVTGAPVVVSDLTKSISHSLIVLLVVALAVMAVTLALVFRARLRLLPLVVALAATGLTFGLLSLVGASLTMASIAVLPVLIGLAVDYAIQLQSRVQEAQAAGGGHRRRGRAHGASAGRRPSPPPPPRPPRASSCSCSRRCRWSAASGCCSSRGSRWRSAAR